MLFDGEAMRMCCERMVVMMWLVVVVWKGVGAVGGGGTKQVQELA